MKHKRRVLLMFVAALAARTTAIRHDELSRQIPADFMPTEMVPVAQRLNDMLLRPEEAFRRERAITTDAAHELRTPLAGMRSTLDVAPAQPPLPKIKGRP